ncbi:HAD-IIA family hydrolase [Mahella australiensis]|uniref:Acid sugar phosphatase n=1 Tax=Mahella australiensis (strain DSM 15567 / CIP 107919 / 50-1 BON) TaxID=697281 RepID=F3ZW04_MAHA5|nr:HAD-IIA family hydrolase [Mahella australiensis]AEE95378.1 phosphoglycolate phosphatase [Mahella australiensis 50-1 BON]
MALNNIKCFILDMDGTFYLGNRLLPGAMEFIDFLKATGRDYLFLTNNSSKSAAFYADKIRRMGLNDITGDKVFTSGQATAIYLKRQNKGRRVFLVGTQYLRQELEEYGLIVVDDEPDFVVVGFDTTLTYDKLWKACDFIREGVTYIATHPDLNCPVEGGVMPDCGAIIAFIEASTSKQPFIVGKPYGEIIKCIFEKTGLGPQQLAIVGDRLYTDIQTGINGGITSILVLTGETTVDDLEHSAVKPDYVVDGIGDIIKLVR